MKIEDIIPPNDYQHRNGFDNKRLIDTLKSDEKEYIEGELFKRLLNDGNDMLVIETLAYLKSERSIPILKERIEKMTDMGKIITSSAIFSINNDATMIDICLNSFKKLDNKYQIIPAFYHLAIFRNPITDSAIKAFFTNKDYLLSYNAKQALHIRTT